MALNPFEKKNDKASDRKNDPCSDQPPEEFKRFKELTKNHIDALHERSDGCTQEDQKSIDKKDKGDALQLKWK